MTGDSISLAEVTQDPLYFRRVLEIVRRMHSERSASRAVDLLQEIAGSLGAEAAIFLSFIPEDKTRGSYRILLACDVEFVNAYDAQLPREDDPLLLYARSGVAPVRGSELLPSPAASPTLIQLAARFGFQSNVIVPARSQDGLARIGVLCLGSSREGYFEAEEGYLALRLLALSIAMQFHEWWVARLGDQLTAVAGIDEQDRALLALEAQGLTSKQIARRLSLSVHCVDSRIRRIRRRLRSPNRQAAVRLAQEYGVVDPSPLQRKQLLP
jgi:DNA-binding CsgD family transcriptional regulator